MTGIREMFADLDEEAHYHCSNQLWLLAWRHTQGRRQEWRDRKREAKPRQTQVHHCSKCGEPGHRGVWRGQVICTQARAA